MSSLGFKMELFLTRIRNLYARGDNFFTVATEKNRYGERNFHHYFSFRLSDSIDNNIVTKIKKKKKNKLAVHIIHNGNLKLIISTENT